MLQFEDGSTGIADLSEYPDDDNVFRQFLDIDYFKCFRIEYGTLIWGNGELDIAPETLYTIATGKPVTYKLRKTEFSTIRQEDIIPLRYDRAMYKCLVEQPNGADLCFCHGFCWEQNHGVKAEQKHVPNRPVAGRIDSSSGMLGRI